mgnify:CR=1 FL=1
MTVAQILAVVIFVAMFGLIVSEKIERHLVSLGCGLLMIVLVFGLSMHSMPAIWNTLALRDFFTAGFWYQAKEAAESSSGINWATILFIAGMMIMVEGMGRAGFFPLAVPAYCKGCKVPDNSAFYYFYGNVQHPGHVY